MFFVTVINLQWFHSLTDPIFRTGQGNFLVPSVGEASIVSLRYAREDGNNTYTLVQDLECLKAIVLTGHMALVYRSYN